MKRLWTSPTACAAVIVLLTVVTYLPSLHGGFVFDDPAFTTENRMIKASDGLYRFWFTTEAADYYPLTSSLWWAEWRLWGNNPAGYHAVNVLLHAVNAVLVWMILRRLKIPGAWLAAVVFAIHPVNVATAAWISEQKNTLSMLFFALSILLYLRFDDATDMRPAGPRSGAAEWVWYGLSLAAGLLALLSKTAVVMLPVVLLGCVWWTRGAVRRKDVWRTVPFFAFSLVLAVVTIWFQHYRALEGRTFHTASFASRLAAAGWAPWFYLSKALVPVNLTMVYPKWQVDPSRWVSYLPGVILIGCLIVFWYRRGTWGRPLLFGLGYFVVTLFPVLGFFYQGFYASSLVADHWQYYSIIGPIALAVAGGRAICHRLGERGRDIGVLASAVVIGLLGVAAWNRCGVYESNETLWRDNLKKNPNAWLAHNNLGAALVRMGRTEEAMAQYEQALRIKPDYATAHNNLGVVLRQTGHIQQAIHHYEEALRINPDMADAHNNLGFVLARLGRLNEAIEQYRQALRIEPAQAEVHHNLGLALSQVGKIDEAIGQYQQALELKPDYPEARFNLGLAFEHAVRIREAIEQYEQALQLKPDYAEAQNNLAWLLATRVPTAGGNPIRAVSLARRACELTDNHVAPYLDTLAAAQAAAGRFQEAIDTAQRAIALARAAGQPQVASEIESRLELYRSGRPYRPTVEATDHRP